MRRYHKDLKDGSKMTRNTPTAFSKAFIQLHTSVSHLIRPTIISKGRINAPKYNIFQDIRRGKSQEIRATSIMPGGLLRMGM
jgi:hypothetical protein